MPSGRPPQTPDARRSSATPRPPARQLELLDRDDRLAFERLLQSLRLSFLASPALVIAAFGAPAAPFAALIAAATLGSFAAVEWPLRRAPDALLHWQLRLRLMDCALVFAVLFAYHGFLRDAYYDSVYVLFVCAAAATHGRCGALLLAPLAGTAVLACRLAHITLGVFPFEVRHLTDAAYYAIFFAITGLAVAHLMERSARAAERREATFRLELATRNDALERTAAARDAALRQAESALRARDTFIAAASHDLKNPLAVIIGTVELLERRLAIGRFEPHQDAPRLARVLETARRMLAQLEELVDAARSGHAENAGPHGPSPEDTARHRQPTDLAELVRRTAAAHAPSAGSRPLRLDLVPGPLVGEWDPVGLGRVLDNLLSNAIKYSPDSPHAEITLHLRQENGAALLRVRDRGCGIPEAEQARVFEPFFRASNAGSAPGSGLGLAAARDVVATLEGTLSLASREGEGTEVTITLPIRAPHPGTPVHLERHGAEDSAHTRSPAAPGGPPA